MSVPVAPPLNGRRVAEFYVASEVSRRSVLREYAKPREEQEARIIIYDPVRRILPSYFQSGRDPSVLTHLEEQLRAREFKSRDFSETWYKANSSAIAALRDIDLGGTFDAVESRRASVYAGGLRIISTVDVYATFKPKRGKRVRVGLIVNPVAPKMRPEKRDLARSIECEIAVRAAASCSIPMDRVLYVDLPKGTVTGYTGPKGRIWDEIGATCELIVRDWRDIRISMSREESSSG